MKPGSDITLTIPPALAAEIQAAADEEHRPAIEVLRDAVRVTAKNSAGAERSPTERTAPKRLALPRPMCCV